MFYRQSRKIGLAGFLRRVVVSITLAFIYLFGGVIHWRKEVKVIDRGIWRGVYHESGKYNRWHKRAARISAFIFF